MSQEDEPNNNKEGKLKIILEFVSKAFYPMIIVTLIILLQPHISKIDWNKLLERIVSIKIAGGEIKLGTSGENLKDKNSASNDDTKKDIKENSQYTVLVFYREHVKNKAITISEKLLDEGYKSSSTKTSFLELQILHSEGTIYISYNEDGEKISQEIGNLITILKKNSRIKGDLKIERHSRTLRRGEVQVLLF